MPIPLHVHKDPLDIFGAFGLSVLGNLCGIVLIEQRRLSRRKHHSTLLQLAAGLTFATVGIFGGHVTAFLGAKLDSPASGNHLHLPVHVHVPMAFLAWVVCAACCCLSLEVASRDKFFGTNSSERVAMLSSDVKQLSLKQLQVGGKAILYLRLLLGAPTAILLSGLIMAVGMVAPQYIIFTTSTIAGCGHSLNWPWVILTMSVAFLVSTTLVWVMFRVLTIKPRWEPLRLVTGLGFSGVIMGVHFTGMRSFNILPQAPLLAPGGGTAPPTHENRGGLTVVLVPFFVVWCILAFTLTIYDLRTTVLLYKTDVDNVISMITGALNIRASRIGAASTSQPPPSSSSSSRPAAGNPLLDQQQVDGAKLERVVLDSALILGKHAVNTVSGKRRTSGGAKRRRTTKAKAGGI